MWNRFATTFALLLIGVAPAIAAPYTFSPVPVPVGGTSYGGFAINDAGQIAGSYYETALSSNSTIHGFLDTGSSTVTLDVPGANFTIVTGLSDNGNVAGQYLFPNGQPSPGRQGFIYSGGVYTPVTDPQGTYGSFIHGVNSAGEVVGTSQVASFPETIPPVVHGVTWSAGVFSPLLVPGATETDPFGINDAGQIVGSYVDASGTHGFLNTGGTFTTLNVPGAGQTLPTAISNNGEIIGSYVLPGDTVNHGFADIGGTFTSFDAPGATGFGTFPTGVNDAGLIVGDLQLPTSDTGSFIATPTATTPADVPEPATAALFATGLLAVVTFRLGRSGRAGRASQTGGASKNG